jgi:plasmid stabilization system protein ParE
MPRALILAPRARRDPDAISGWLTQPGPGPAARRKLAAVRAVIGRLPRHPCRYPVGEHSGVRELPCAGGYRGLYEVNPDTGRDVTAGDVQVSRVFGPGQNRGTL